MSYPLTLPALGPAGLALSALCLFLFAPSIVRAAEPAPTATLSQSAATTTSNGATAEAFTISWSSTDATSCTLAGTNANGVLVNPWATGVSGSKAAAPVVVGTLHFWIDCTGPGGTAHKDMYHTVVAAPTAQSFDAAGMMAAVIAAPFSILIDSLTDLFVYAGIG